MAYCVMIFTLSRFIRKHLILCSFVVIAHTSLAGAQELPVNKKACETAATQYMGQLAFVGDASVRPMAFDQYVHTKAVLEFLIEDMIALFEGSLGGENVQRYPFFKMLQRYQAMVEQNVLRVGLTSVPNRLVGSDPVQVRDGNISWLYSALVFGSGFYDQLSANLRIAQGDLFAALVCYHQGANQGGEDEDCMRSMGFVHRQLFWSLLTEAGLGNHAAFELAHQARTDTLWDQFESDRLGIALLHETSGGQAELGKQFSLWLQDTNASEDYARLMPFAEACLKQGFLKRPLPGLAGLSRSKQGAGNQDPSLFWFLSYEMIRVRPGYTPVEWKFASVPSAEKVYPDPARAAFADDTYLYYSFHLSKSDTIPTYVRVSKAALTAAGLKDSKFLLSGFANPNRVVFHASPIAIIGAGQTMLVPFPAITESEMRSRRISSDTPEAKIDAAFAQIPVIKDYKKMTASEFMEKYRTTPSFMFGNVNYL